MLFIKIYIVTTLCHFGVSCLCEDADVNQTVRNFDFYEISSTVDMNDYISHEELIITRVPTTNALGCALQSVRLGCRLKGVLFDPKAELCGMIQWKSKNGSEIPIIGIGQTSLYQLSTNFNTEASEIKTTTEAGSPDQSEITTAIPSSLDRSEITTAIQSSLDRSEITTAIQSSLDRSEITTAIPSSLDRSEITTDVQRSLDQPEVTTNEPRVPVQSAELTTVQSGVNLSNSYCQSGFTKSHYFIDGQQITACLLFKKIKSDYFLAKRSCNNKGGFVASAKTIEKFALLKQLANSESFWVGLTDKDLNDIYVWEEDGTPLSDEEIEEVFEPGSFVNSDRDCVNYQARYAKLKDRRCGVDSNYRICEVQPSYS